MCSIQSIWEKIKSIYHFCLRNKNTLLKTLSWIIAVSMLLYALIFSPMILSKAYGILWFLILIGLVLLPNIETLNIGNIFKIKVRELNETIKELRNTIINLNLNQSNTQNVIFGQYPLPGVDKSVEIKIGPIVQKYLDAGIIDIKNADFPNAIENFKVALKLDGDNWYAAMYLGYIYLTIEDKSEIIGLNKSECLMESIFNSYWAIQKDRSNFMQFMNLGIAQAHLGGEGLIRMGINNLIKTREIISQDNRIESDSYLKLVYGKATSFIGEFYKKLEMTEEAVEFRKKAIEVFENIPEPKPPGYQKWHDDTISALEKLNSTQTK